MIKTMDENLKNEIMEISKKIYEYAEIGSEERKSSKLLVDSLRSHGFRVEYPYMNKLHSGQNGVRESLQLAF